MMELLKLYAGIRTDGSAVQEEVPVEGLGGGRFRILQSPGLVLGVAAGDVIELTSAGRFKVVSRGRNLCVQVFAPASSVDRLENALTGRLKVLGGRLDGRGAQLLVYTVPVSVGFPAVEEVFRECVGGCDGAEWYYGNVYDPDDGVTPLGWW